MSLPQPSVLGLKKSFGFGDRLGLATPGHVAAVKGTGFAPIFAQQSVREMERTQRTPQEVLSAAQTALAKLGWTQPWGADADHHKTPDDVRKTAAAGFTFFTIDPSAFVNNAADRMSQSELEVEVARMETDGVFAKGWSKEYLGRRFEVSEGLALTFTAEPLDRAAVKYGRAIAHTGSLSGHIASACAGRPFEIEVSVDETDSVTSPLDHLFCGLELKRRQVPNVVSLAPRFIGDFEKGIDYRGDLKQFETQLREHVAVAKFCGPYKISVHSGSDKFSIYPIVGRVCGELLHVKTAGTSYLEALRVVARTAPALFAEIVEFCRGRFENDRKSYHLSATLAEVNALPRYSGPKDEAVFLDQVAGRQLLHVTFGSVLTQGTDSKGRRFKEGILAQLNQHAELHLEVIERHFAKHLSLLNRG
jgi:tagaturonate epimerase